MTKKITIKDMEVELSDKQVENLLEQLQEDKGDRWNPEEGDTYSFVNNGGSICGAIWVDHSEDLWRYSQRNCLKTKDEAFSYKSYLEAVARIKDSATLKPDWEDAHQVKHFIYYVPQDGRLYTALESVSQTTSHAWYATKKDAEQAIKTLKKEYELVFEWERNHG